MSAMASDGRRDPDGNALVAACDADAWDAFHGARDLKARISYVEARVLDGTDVFLRVAGGTFCALFLALFAFAAAYGHEWGIVACLTCLLCVPMALAWSGLRSPGRTRELSRLFALARKREAATTTTFEVERSGIKASFADFPDLSFDLDDTKRATIRPEPTGRHVSLRVEWGHRRHDFAEVPFVRFDDPAVAAFNAFETAVRNHDPAADIAARLLAKWSVPFPTEAAC